MGPSVTTSGTETQSARARQVSAYADLAALVRAAGLMERRYTYYWWRTLGLVATFVAAWVAFALLGNSWFQLVVAGVLAVVLAQFGFLGHDAAHRQVFATSPANVWFSRVLAGVFTGLSYGWWSHKHNRHHGAPNQVGKDPDIDSGVVAFTPEAAAGRSGPGAWFVRRQGYLFFPLLMLEGVNLHVASVRALMRRRDVEHRRLELSMLLVRLTAYPIVLVLVLPPGKAAAFLGVQLALFGLLLGGSFAPNHKGMPIVPADVRIDFLRRQVLMSRNIRGGLFTDLAMGGLNLQIEHHLFPSMPRPNLRRAQPIVRAFCLERGVTYTETSLGGSYRIVLRYLNAVGLRSRDPFTCPLLQQYRA